MLDSFQANEPCQYPLKYKRTSGFRFSDVFSEHGNETLA